MVSMVTREMIDDTGHGSTIFNMMVVTIAKIIQKNPQAWVQVHFSRDFTLAWCGSWGKP